MRHFLRLVAALALACGLAWGVDFAALKPQGYVSDYSGVIDGGSRAALERYCKAVESATGVQIALVTLPTLQGEPVEDVANTLFRKWGVGQKGSHEGVLLLLVTGDRRSRLEVGYGLEPILPDGFAGSVLRQMRPALREGRHGEALLAAAQTIGERIAAAKGVRIEAGAPRPRRPARTDLPWPLLVGGAGMLLWLLGLAGRNRMRAGGGAPDYFTAMIAGHMVGRSLGGGRGGGGFGGFDSSDSFGGFGGGDSGGGGASSDW